jgi:UDP:flavonoid glycosyltransferase YjiC (YdhE family)
MPSCVVVRRRSARIQASGTGLFLPLAQLNAEALRGLVDEVLGTPSYRDRVLAMKAAITELDGLGMEAELIEKAFAADDQVTGVGRQNAS